MSKYKNITIFTFVLVLTFSFSMFGQVAGDANGGDPGSKVIRVGVIMPKVELKDAKGEVEPGEALRNTYASLLNSDSIELVALDAKLTALAIEEAAQLECDYILNLTLKQEVKKSGGGGLFGRVIRDTGTRATYEAAGSVPYGGGTGERIARTAAQSAIINTGYTISNMQIEVKKNDEFSLNYGLTTAKGQSVSTKDYEGKAKKNNDDTVIMGLIESSANDIAKALIANKAQ